MAGAVSQYAGAAVAATLFDHLAPGGVALLRVLGAAAFIVALRRSWRRRWEPAVLGRAAAFGVCLAAMNLCFYFAMDRLPLGNAVAIEFTGPVAVAAAGARSPRSALALLLAASGVAVLAGVEAEGTAAGVAFALLAGAFWAGYILLGHRVAHGPAAVDGLGLGMLAGALAISRGGRRAGLAVAAGPGRRHRAALQRHPLPDRPGGDAPHRPAPLRPASSPAASHGDSHGPGCARAGTQRPGAARHRPGDHGHRHRPTRPRLAIETPTAAVIQVRPLRRALLSDRCDGLRVSRPPVPGESVEPRLRPGTGRRRDCRRIPRAWLVRAVSIIAPLRGR